MAGSLMGIRLVEGIKEDQGGNLAGIRDKLKEVCGGPCGGARDTEGGA